jgi:hypothetical protein
MSTRVYSFHTLSRKIKISIVKTNDACEDVPKFVCVSTAANSAEKEDFSCVQLAKV